MLVTKKYYKKRQAKTVAACTVFAAIIGTIQTAYIVHKCKKE